MNIQIQKMIAVTISTIISIAIVGGIRFIADLQDLAAHVTMVAILASVIAIDAFQRLQARDRHSQDSR